MSASVVAKRYAQALFEVASDKKCLEQVEEDLEKVVETFSASPELKSWIRHPATTAEQKKEIFSRIFPELNGYTKNFLFLLADRRREEIVADVLREYKRLANEQRGIVEAIVTTPFPLTAKDRKQLIAAFEPIVGKKLAITENVDSDILGGVIVQVGDRLYDGSLRTKLSRFKERLKGSRVG
jgi:F-type H+-transporting ATPase subunit delta